MAGFKDANGVTLSDIRVGMRFSWRRSRGWGQHKPKTVVRYDQGVSGGTVFYKTDGGKQPQQCCGHSFIERAIVEPEVCMVDISRTPTLRKLMSI